MFRLVLMETPHPTEKNLGPTAIERFGHPLGDAFENYMRAYDNRYSRGVPDQTQIDQLERTRTIFVYEVDLGLSDSDPIRRQRSISALLQSNEEIARKVLIEADRRFTVRNNTRYRPQY